MLKILREINNSPAASTRLPILTHHGVAIGSIEKEVYQKLEQHEECDRLFIRKGSVLMLTDMRTATELFNQLLMKCRDDFECLQGWRGETFTIRTGVFTDVTNIVTNQTFKIERSACSLFGLRTYGVHLNGYRIIEGQYYYWIAKRSLKKSTYPGFLDQICAGGISSGDTPRRTLEKEAGEEAGIGQKLIKDAKSVGTVSYISKYGNELDPGTEYCYDLLLPHSFKPEPCDGEVHSFDLVDIPTLKSLMLSGSFKPQAFLVALDFLVRHGLLNVALEEEGDEYLDICMGLHQHY